VDLLLGIDGAAAPSCRRGRPETQSAATRPPYPVPWLTDPAVGGAPAGPPDPPSTTLSLRPRWFKAPGRAGEPGFDELRESRRAGGDGRPRKADTPGRVVKWVLIGIAAWIGLSLLLFLVSAQIEQSNVSDEAKKALDGGSPDVASNILVLGPTRPGQGARLPGQRMRPPRWTRSC